MRQELLAPVTALVGYGEMLIEKAERLELEDLAPDLERILTAAQDLLELVDRLLDEAAAPAQAIGRRSRGDPGQAPARSAQPSERHQGLCRAAARGARRAGGAAIRADLEALLGEAERCWRGST